MQTLKAGYNLVEEGLLGDKFEQFEEAMSVVEFLRYLRQGKALPAKLRVIGLDYLLYKADDRDRLSIYIRRLFSHAADQLMRRNPILQFPMPELTMGSEPKFIFNEEEVKLQPLFGGRLQAQTVGWWHAPFSIP